MLTPWSNTPVDETKFNRARAAEAATGDDVQGISADELGRMFAG